MKNIKILFAALLMSFLITSCSQEKSQVFESSSQDKNLTLSVWGQREGSMEPWTVYIITDYKSQKDTVFTELHADELNSKNIEFNWSSNTDCTVKLTHRDGVVNLVPIKYDLGR